ncbi:hypothetical protein NW768_006813 [Fusarium equiseti]|uniref:Ubiquitin-like domain-containing protein n=1 Tax=Fusarium equiseti TaxID=61235 RepID=A0ABQ8R992_FUSEQ|nr:hypothetical protein NW768_006813 [Fusarium equiseti]
MPLILETCERPIKSFGSESCPLCADWEPPSTKENVKSFSRHLARHLQQLALEALPLAIDGLEIGDISALSDEESSLSYRSSNEEAVRNQPTDPPSATIQGEGSEVDVDTAIPTRVLAIYPDIIVDEPTYSRRDSPPTIQGEDSDSLSGPKDNATKDLQEGANVLRRTITDWEGVTGGSAFEQIGSKGPVTPEAAESSNIEEGIEGSEAAIAENATGSAEYTPSWDDIESVYRGDAAEIAAIKFNRRIQEKANARLEDSKRMAEKAPVRFKDAVGRKFSFPFHLCATWQGMEDLIKQAFMHVDVLGRHVMEGHYDLIAPGGEIILPSVWEKVVQPDMAITMTMWPMDKMPPLPSHSASPAHSPGSIYIPPRPFGRGVLVPPGYQPPPTYGTPNVVTVGPASVGGSSEDSESDIAGFLFDKLDKKKKAVPSSSADQSQE